MAAKAKRAKRPLTQVLEAARRNRYKVIHERNLLILALAKHAGFAVHLVKVDDAKLSEPDAWDKVLCLHTPAGQLHWKLSPADQKEFSSLKTLRKSDYDGAKAIEKSVRLEGLHTLPSAFDVLIDAATRVLSELQTVGSASLGNMAALEAAIPDYASGVRYHGRGTV